MTATLIVTRPYLQGRAFVDDILDRWAAPLAVVTSPLIEIVPLHVDLPDGTDVIFTSANGVAQVERLGLSSKRHAWCVGEKTAQAASDLGFIVTTGPGTAEGLVATIAAETPARPLAHIRGTNARGDITTNLQAAGIQCHDVIAYDQQAVSLTSQALAALQGFAPVVVPLFSPRSAGLFAKQGPFASPLFVPVISENAIPDVQYTRCFVAKTPSRAAMISATLTALRDACTD